MSATPPLPNRRDQTRLTTYLLLCGSFLHPTRRSFLSICYGARVLACTFLSSLRLAGHTRWGGCELVWLGALVLQRQPRPLVEAVFSEGRRTVRDGVQGAPDWVALVPHQSRTHTLELGLGCPRGSKTQNCQEASQHLSLSQEY